jgi:protein-L-isoaspartate(D-aspartate) O-methyltransferase
MDDSSLTAARRFFAEEIRAVAHLRSRALVEALATVPRERFLGPGPWQILAPEAGMGEVAYWTTEDADPRHLYHNVAVAIAPERQINNGQPSLLATWIDALELAPGERAVHLGCGVGYYTAVMAEVVGPAGHATGFEVEADLARRARENLAGMAQVEVVHGDGGALDPETADAILVNAGATHPLPSWLDALRPGGRLLLPLTFTAPSAPPSTVGRGFGLLIKREAGGFSARFLTPVAIYPCAGARDEAMNQRLLKAIQGGDWTTVRSLRRDPHESAASCWLHGEGFCLSRTDLGNRR